MPRRFVTRRIDTQKSQLHARMASRNGRRRGGETAGRDPPGGGRGHRRRLPRSCAPLAEGGMGTVYEVGADRHRGAPRPQGDARPVCPRRRPARSLRARGTARGGDPERSRRAGHRRRRRRADAARSTSSWSCSKVRRSRASCGGEAAFAWVDVARDRAPDRARARRSARARHRASRPQAGERLPLALAARRASRSWSRCSTSASPRRWQSGGESTRAILGTPAWMAPEQSTARRGGRAPGGRVGARLAGVHAARRASTSSRARTRRTRRRRRVLREVVLEPMVPASRARGPARAAPIGFPRASTSGSRAALHRNAERRFADATRRLRGAREASGAIAAQSPFPVASTIRPRPLVGSVASLRIDTPITAIETPHPSRVRVARAP